MNPHIFREYDIRGVVDRDFPAGLIHSLGKAVGTYFRKHNRDRITLGRDVRLSSDRLHRELLRALVETGLHVMDIGVCATPLLYFSIHHLQAHGGVMITGSHNPPEFNGFKVCLGPETIYGDEIQELRKLMEEQTFAAGNGAEQETDVLPAYMDTLRSGIRIKRPLKVVLDAGNGTAGLAAPELIRSLGCETLCLYCEPDGHFPFHHPDPTIPKNLEDLQRVVLEEKADLGISFDGDADRIGVVDEGGRIIWADRLLILFARALLQEHPGACIVSEVKCSKILFEEIEKRGGRPVMWKAGHSLMKSKMKEEEALLGGELSGHLFFADRYFGYDDAIYAACRLLELLAGEDRPLSAHLSDLPRTFSTEEIRVACPDEIKFGIIHKARDFFKESYEVIDVDGARIAFPNGWGLVRASNTQPAIVFRFESDTESGLTEIRRLVEGKIAEIRSECLSQA